MTTAKSFVIFGNPIAKSKSPVLHNTAFEHLGLPHHYRYIETPTLDGVNWILKAKDFGGASVTMPFKQEIRSHIDSVTPVAALLGAVNTIIPVKTEKGQVELVGDNTDYLGILRELQAKLKEEQLLGPELIGLVIGAGGAGRAAVHALHEAGMTTIYLFNRTRKTAEDLVFSFPSFYNLVLIDDLSAVSFTEGLPVAIVGTVPAKATCIEGDERGEGQISIPKDGLLREGGVFVCDMAYLPRETPLLRLAHQLGPNQCSTSNGLDVLLQQGFEQFRLWNQLEPPTELCRQKVVEEYERENP
ncbi:hypothetical protein JCM8547_000121 [Rhodosporidiobolus lusitaniae]